MDFATKLNQAIESNNSLLCVGLDPDFDKLPPNFKNNKEPLFDFNKLIIDETAKFICAFKLNSAFYEAYGIDGLTQLKKTIEYLKKTYPDIPIILDAKRADIANTAKMYAKSIYEYWDADATTVYPHLGLDSIEPFLSYKGNHTFLLIKTSNPDSSTFQNLKTEKGLYYIAVAQEIKKWNIQNIGIFVGATYPDEIKKLREIFPDKIFLSAGIGAQDADLRESVIAGIDKNKKGIIFNASRSIIYSDNPGQAAQNLRDEINKYR